MCSFIFRWNTILLRFLQHSFIVSLLTEVSDWDTWKLWKIFAASESAIIRNKYLQKQKPSLLSFLTFPTHRSRVKCCSPELHYWWAFLNSLLSLAPCTVNQSLWAKHFNKEIFLSTSKFEQISTSYYRFLHKTITSCPIHSRNF